MEKNILSIVLDEPSYAKKEVAGKVTVLAEEALEIQSKELISNVTCPY
jgi:hypothetical protein